MQFGLGVDSMPDLRGDRAGAKAGDQQDERVEQRHDLPGAELRDPDEQEGRERDEEEWGNRPGTFDPGDEHYGATAANAESTTSARTTTCGHRDPGLARADRLRGPREDQMDRMP